MVGVHVVELLCMWVVVSLLSLWTPAAIDSFCIDFFSLLSTAVSLVIWWTFRDMTQAVKFGGLLWCSGQLGLLPATGTFAGDTTALQADQALKNLSAICREAGTSLTKALRCTIYLVDLADFATVNAIYERCFEAPFPARATVQVTALPKGGRIEIDAVVAL
jgi:2-iminobutanoate/2-iminopropanoate deaminase